MVAVSFRCGHGAAAGDPGVVAIRRVCPLCMLLDETHRSRAELLRGSAHRRSAPRSPARRVSERRTTGGAPAATIATPRPCARCSRAPGAPSARVNAAGPSSAREAGVAFMNPGLRTRTSQTEQRLKILLGERIRLHHGVNAVRIARTFYGRQEVWPDILVPQLRIAVEYDDPGRSRRAHLGLKEASDLDKDDALREVGWEVIRIRAGGLTAFGPYSVVCRTLTPAVVDEVVACMRRIRGDAAVDAIVVGASGGLLTSSPNRCTPLMRGCSRADRVGPPAAHPSAGFARREAPSLLLPFLIVGGVGLVLLLISLVLGDLLDHFEIGDGAISSTALAVGLVVFGAAGALTVSMGLDLVWAYVLAAVLGDRRLRAERADGAQPHAELRRNTAVRGRPHRRREVGRVAARAARSASTGPARSSAGSPTPTRRSPKASASASSSTRARA